MTAPGMWRAAICVAVIAISACANAQLSPVITLPSGLQLQGLASPLAYQFLGVPFAAPPIGTLRWRAAEPAAPWSGMIYECLFCAIYF
jgi:para-nitrobenzyl esterase